MQQIPTILKNSKSWSNSTQRSEYNKHSNNWVDFNLNVEKLNNCSNSNFIYKFLNTNLSRNYHGNLNHARSERYQTKNEGVIQNSSIKENKVLRQKLVNSRPVEIECKTLLPNLFSVNGQKHIPFDINLNRFDTFETESKNSHKNKPQIINRKLGNDLNYFNTKIINSNHCPKLVPIACNNLFRATSFLEVKPNFNNFNNNSSFLRKNSSFISENYRNNGIKSNINVSCIQEKNYSSSNLTNSQKKISYSANQENSSILLNSKSKNLKMPNYFSSKLFIRNLPKVSINNLSSKPIYHIDGLESNDNGMEVNLTSIKMFSILGFGSTSLVYSAVWRGTEVAVKILGNYAKSIKSSDCNHLNLSINKAIKHMEITKKDCQRYLEFRNEIRIMNLLRHPNIVQYMGGNISSNPPFLICEFCSGGTLFNLLHGDSKKCLESNSFSFSGPSVNLSLYQRIKILQDIARGIHFLHSTNPPIIHRDIKSLNIFLSLPIKSNADVPIAKVGDFGLCQQLFSDKGFINGSGNLVGTYQWMAPEVLTSQIYNEHIDVYSFGMIMYEVLSNRTPFFELGVDVSPEILADEIIKGIRPTLKYIVNDVPIEIKNIMIRCWDPQPSKRGTMLVIINELQHFIEKIGN
ncbi:Serine-threonine/tyrosine-protein kinase [Cryptosporidium hominis]|uniref:Serine-threonine/tyrosine-protein kinase n=1 Tax=Cryptosporidium hominis TaxID=237895 RepID=A0ABX5BBR9_CRYHO|nr:protein Roco7 [Cryptosporidium hominis TU502]PPS93775.1 Serine-threonine/tyrosine-protein kinase [Cryptosporidium hominis]|eukprot:PPS93775.1 Serine-threonine/tyrosine-protein kinase [Cryptosporidium hominis]